MHPDADTDSTPRFAARQRLFQGFRVDAVDRVKGGGEAVVRGRRGQQQLEVRYVETSGEFKLVSGSGEVTPVVGRRDLRDLGPALAQFQRAVPWVESVSGDVLKAVNQAIFPTSLSDFRVRSVSDLGGVVLLTGWTVREEIDVVLDTRTGRLSIIVTSSTHKAPRRPLTTQEAWDLAGCLEARIEGLPVTRQRALLGLLLEATRRQTHH